MKIKHLFERDIERPINGVVKADQLDRDSVWQELDEFVVTNELRKHLNTLVNAMTASLDSVDRATISNGIWISGFFGSGKSHLIKVLTYILDNHEHSHNGESRQAVDFFRDKLDDALLFGDLKRLADAPIDTILFNVDSKADPSAGREALLQVFVKVLNEKQGYSGDHPNIANMERHLDKEGKLDAFHKAFQAAAGTAWLDERDAWEFQRDEVVDALEQTLGQSRDSVEKLIESVGQSQNLTPEKFANLTKDYLDRGGTNQRVMFLVDEVGQFIGNDTHLMLSLQTITEELAKICKGRAWVVVTSQEDFDVSLGEQARVRSNDFSKIQGRFSTRLSLSSSNVDEVIKKRLLEKNVHAATPLTTAYKGKHDILKNQLSFKGAGMSFKSFTDAEDFIDCYPFAAYQFSLVQKIFESIRKAGATGLHLSQGERSTLDAFQHAAKTVGDENIGALVPLVEFYASVEGFLDTSVKRTIDQASDHHALESFDSSILKVLFLIRYIDELPGYVDNIVTLCVNEIDCDRLALRRKVEASLSRLEEETLISRNGDEYFFLTNEERDIGREIKNTTIPSGSESRELGSLIFQDLLKDLKKHTYSVTNSDFSFTRVCDEQVIGSKLDGSIEVRFVSPFGDRFEELQDDGKCILETSHADGLVLVRLPDDPALGRELRTYLQTESFIKNKHSRSETTKRILRDRSTENRERRSRIINILDSMLRETSFFTSGQKLDISRKNVKDALSDALEYTIKNSYSKLSYLKYLHPNPKQEIQSTLRANDVEQVSLRLKTEQANSEALDDLRNYIDLCSRSHKKIVLHDLVRDRYGQRPFGWPEFETVLLIARLVVLKEVELVVNAALLRMEDAYDHMVSSSKQRNVIINKRESADENLISDARSIGKEIFSEQGPASEDGLFRFLKSKLVAWDSSLSNFKQLADTGRYPGSEVIEDVLALLNKYVKEDNSSKFLKRFVSGRDELVTASEHFHELDGFFNSQKPSWDKLQDSFQKFNQNRLQLEQDEEARDALQQMSTILNDPKPYARLHETTNLIHTVKVVNEALVSNAREEAQKQIETFLGLLDSDMDKANVSEPDRAAVKHGLVALRDSATSQSSIAHLAQIQEQADKAYDNAVAKIMHLQTDKGNPEDDQPVIRTKQNLEVRNLWPGLIETQSDIDDFLSKLRSKLEAAINENERVQIK